MASTALYRTLAWRFLFGRRRELLAGTTRTAFLATALGVSAMVIAMALMSGYRHDLKHRLIRGNAAVVAYSVSYGASEDEGVAVASRAIASMDGVTGVRRTAYGEGSLTLAGRPEGSDVTLRGVDAAALRESNVDRASDYQWCDGARSLVARDGILPILVGADLISGEGCSKPALRGRLAALGFAEARPRFTYRSVEVVGTFRTGFSEFDQQWVLLDRSELEKLVGADAALAVLEVAVDDPDRAGIVADRVREAVGDDYLVSDWSELNRELFTALRLQQLALFFVLGLIVLVSTFNVASSLIVLVRDRIRDLGVLAALGLGPKELRRVFLYFGLTLGALGTVAGLLGGSLVAWVLTRFELIRFDPELAAIYFVSSVPFRVTWRDVAAITAFSLLLTLVACWVPARQAAVRNPADALRFE